jgi:hypothetical protein
MGFDPHELRDPFGKWTRGGGGLHVPNIEMQGKLSADEIQSVGDYVHSGSFVQINSHLRGIDAAQAAGDDPFMVGATSGIGLVSDEDSAGYVKQEMEHLDSAIQKSVIKTPVTVYRSFDDAQIKGKTGGMFTDNGYGSTTTDPKIIDQWGGNAVMKIEISSNRHGLWVDGTPGVTSLNQSELLLPRGVRYSILSVDPGPPLVYHVRLVGERHGTQHMAEVRETASIGERAAHAAKVTGKMLVQFISPGWGTSGYYSPEVLQEAASNRIIPAGTHMYADHPSKTSREDRPERSIRDLMAVTTSDAQLASNGALVGEVRVLAPYQELITDLKDHIGVSVLGDATDVYEGEAEGRKGRIIAGLAHINSVDFVTRAGRGGQVLELLESAAHGDRVEVLPDAWLLDGIHVELATALEEVVTSPAGVSGNEKLHAYWRHGEGAAKIRWGEAGDFQRCVDHLGKYIADPKGYCAKMHKDVTGFTPGHAPTESAGDERVITVLEGSNGLHGVDEAGHTYRYKHGWIPLGHTDADKAVAKLSLSQRQAYANHRSSGMSHEDALKALVAGHQADLKTAQKMGYTKGTSVHNNHSNMLKSAQKALRDHQSSKKGTFNHGPSSANASNPPVKSYGPGGPSDAEKLANAAKMFGINSKQYKAALKKYGPKSHTKPPVKGTFHHGRRSANSSESGGTSLGDLEERDFSGKQRSSMADKGHAMSDGSFPIANVSDLKNAIQALGRAKDPAAAKRHIIKRARALKAVGSLPSDWGTKESDVPATRPDSTTTIEETTEVTMGKIQIEEAEYNRVLEEAGRVDELTTELDTEKARAEELAAKLAEATKGATPPVGTPAPRTSHKVVVEQLDEQRHEIAVLKARERARDIIAEEMTEAWVAPSTVARLSSALISDLPLVEGKLDEVALRNACVEARDHAELEAAETLDAAGFGKPTGLGASTPPAGGDAARYTDTITEGLQVFGLSEAAAKTAAKGR